MKKVIVIGCPGSGKSHFSRALHIKTGLSLYHLDMMYWNADKTTVEREVFLARLCEVLSREEWIIDGNYGSTMEQRIEACDTVFFLDYQTDVCLDGVRARRGKVREDMPWVEAGEDAEFCEYVRAFREEQRPGIISLLQKYGDKRIYTFNDRSEADVFLDSLSV